MSNVRAFQLAEDLYIVEGEGKVRKYDFEKEWKQFLKDADTLGITKLVMHEDRTPLCATPFDIYDDCREEKMDYLRVVWECEEDDREDGLIPSSRILTNFTVDDIRNIVHNVPVLPTLPNIGEFDRWDEAMGQYV